MKTVFTTGQVAKIAKVAPRTVSKWFDTGKLVGYRIPGSQDRRIPRANLIKFFRDNGMPQAEELEGEHKFKIVTVCLDPSLATLFPNQPDSNVEFVHVNSQFEAGTVISLGHPPKVVVIDSLLGRSQVLEMIKHLKGKEGFNETFLLVIASEDEANAVYDGASYVFNRPLDPTALTTQLKLYVEADAA